VLKVVAEQEVKCNKESLKQQLDRILLKKRNINNLNDDYPRLKRQKKAMFRSIGHRKLETIKKLNRFYYPHQ
jgi:hypothetical protein